jgi:hypothetical protein
MRRIFDDMLLEVLKLLLKLPKTGLRHSMIPEEVKQKRPLIVRIFSNLLTTNKLTN